ncbi:hypothetical protein THICB2_340014 [Thiomonas sp. CB2]|nr:hypothetical protein THICB2_340014 [Thiomonas sp. CB2]
MHPAFTCVFAWIWSILGGPCC